MLKKLALVFGVVFVLAGILGFVPAFTTTNGDEELLLGILAVGGLHNIVHLLSGVLALVAGSTSEKNSRLYFLGFGSVYALVTVIGFIQGDTVLGLFHVNTADNFFHLILTVALLGIGLAVKPTDHVTTV